MGLKQFVDEHPLKVLISVAVAVATTTAGVTGYLISKKDEIEKSRSEMDAKAEIATLKTRLSSIERRVGTDEQSFFDISKLILTPDRVKDLDGTYKTMADGAFFIAEPAMKRWTFSQTSELAMLKEVLGLDANDPMLVALAAAIGKKNVYLWRSPESFRVHPAAKEGIGADLNLTFFPYVLVQVLSDKDLQGMVAAVGKMLNEPSDVEKVVKEIDRVSTDKPGGGTPDKTSDVASTEKAAEQAANVATRTERTLSELFRGDLVAVLLQGLVGANMQLTQMFTKTQFALKTAQKKGNVLYMETRLEFDDVAINGKDRGRLIVDQEYFVVTSPSAVIVVKVQIPSSDGRAEAYSWVAQWLTGLRLPLVR